MTVGGFIRPCIVRWGVLVPGPVEFYMFSHPKRTWMYSYDTGASVIPKHIWIGFITFASDINPMNAELEIISIKNKYKRKL